MPDESRPTEPKSIRALNADDVHVWQWRWTRELGDLPPRRWLAAYAGVPAEQLAIVRGVHGKPYLATPHDDLVFSWSHSGDRALLAVARGIAELGIDIERSRPRSRVLELAKRFFAPSEAVAIGSLPETDRLAAFLDLWTAKEAVLKAHGHGLSYGLHRVRFALEADTVPVAFEGEIAPASDWQLHRIAQGEGWHAAVAWRGGPRRLRVFQVEANDLPPFTPSAEPFA
jgi:4'-phosphopantetheinyl transferase